MNGRINKEDHHCCLDVYSHQQPGMFDKGQSFSELKGKSSIKIEKL